MAKEEVKEGREMMNPLRELFRGRGYIDGITIINLEGEILFTAKFNGNIQRFLDLRSRKSEHFRAV